MTTPQLLSLLGFVTLMSFTPGPNTMLASALGANFGLRRSLPFIAAVPCGWLVLLAASAAGVGALLQAAPLAAAALRWGGVAYMLWLASRLLRLARLDAREIGTPVGFAQGVLLQFLNAKAWLAAMTIVAGWIAPGAEDLREVARRTLLLAPLFAFFALASNASYALLGAALRRWLMHGRRLRVFNAALALALAATAVWMAFV
jgi:threonine/homoserine/homoserine lactone efflux protein